METIENYLTSLINDRDSIVAALGLPNIPNNATFTELIPHLQELGKVHRVATVEEMEALPNPKTEDVCIVTTEHINVYEDGDTITTITFPDEFELDEALPSNTSVSLMSFFKGARSNSSRISLSGNQLSINLNIMIGSKRVNQTVRYNISEEGKYFKRATTNGTITFTGNITVDYSNIPEGIDTELLHRLFVNETGTFNGLYVYDYGWEHYDIMCHAKAEDVMEGTKVYTSHGVVNGRFNIQDKEFIGILDRGVESLSNISNDYLSNAFASNVTMTNCSIAKIVDTSNLTNISNMFNGCVNLTDPGVENWNTINVVDASSLFHNCYNLIDTGMENWNTSNLTDISNIFNACRNLINTGMENWDKSNITNIDGAFYQVYNANFMFLNTWDVSNIESFSNTFSYLNWTNHPEVNLSNWNMSSAKDLSFMLSHCSNIPIGIENWNTSNVTNLSGIFYFVNWSGTRTLNLSGWNTINVTDISQMFAFCLSNAYVNIEGWDTSNVVNMHTSFQGYVGPELNLSGWNTINVTDMSHLFSKQAKINIEGWDTSNVVNMQGLFSQINHSAITQSYVNTVMSQLNTCNVRDMQQMFHQPTISSWTNINLSHLDFTNVENMRYMFNSIPTLRNIDGLNGRDFPNLKSATSMFSNLNNYNPTPGLELCNLVNLTNGWLFTNLPNFTGYIHLTNLTSLIEGFYMFGSIGVNNIQVTNVNSLSNAMYMFTNLPNVTTISITGNLSNLSQMAFMFSQCPKLNNIEIDWSTLTNVTNVARVFNSSNNLPVSVLTNFCEALCIMNIPEENRVLNNLCDYSPIHSTNYDILNIGVPQSTIDNLTNNGWTFINP